jgi:hypothetical protein
VPTDPFALPCHPECAIGAEDRDWRAIGVKDPEGVTRKQTRCPQCKTAYTAYRRPLGDGSTVEWLRHTPFRVTAAALEDASAPVWQDAEVGTSTGDPLVVGLAEQQERTAGLGELWSRSTQLCAPTQALLAGGEVFAVPGDLLLERREKWNAQDRRLALLWSPRLERQVVAWHGFARLLQD